MNRSLYIALIATTTLTIGCSAATTRHMQGGDQSDTTTPDLTQLGLTQKEMGRLTRDQRQLIRDFLKHGGKVFQLPDAVVIHTSFEHYGITLDENDPYALSYQQPFGEGVAVSGRRSRFCPRRGTKWQQCSRRTRETLQILRDTPDWKAPDLKNLFRPGEIMDHNLYRATTNLRIHLPDTRGLHTTQHKLHVTAMLAFWLHHGHRAGKCGRGKGTIKIRGGLVPGALKAQIEGIFRILEREHYVALHDVADIERILINYAIAKHRCGMSRAERKEAIAKGRALVKRIMNKE